MSFRDGFEISTDPARLDLDVIHGYLSREAYWSPGVVRSVVERAIAGSLPFGLYEPGGAQAGFARPSIAFTTWHAGGTPEKGSRVARSVVRC